MQFAPNDSFVELIERNPYLLLVVEHLGKMDFQKNVTINDFCKQSKLPLHVFVSLINIYSNNNIKINLNEWKHNHVLILIDFLDNSHNYYKKEKYPLINSLLQELKNNIKSNETKLLIKFFNEYFAEVLEHLDYEEKIVFPYVRQILSDSKWKELRFSSDEYQEHHNNIEEKLSDLKTLLMHHVKFGQYSYIGRQIIFHLYELEFDLHAHSKIEENLLIPLIKKFEKSLYG